MKLYTGSSLMPDPPARSARSTRSGRRLTGGGGGAQIDAPGGSPTGNGPSGRPNGGQTHTAPGGQRRRRPLRCSGPAAGDTVPAVSASGGHQDEEAEDDEGLAGCWRARAELGAPRRHMGRPVNNNEASRGARRCGQLANRRADWLGPELNWPGRRVVIVVDAQAAAATGRAHDDVKTKIAPDKGPADHSIWRRSGANSSVSTDQTVGQQLEARRRRPHCHGNLALIARTDSWPRSTPPAHRPTDGPLSRLQVWD